jgi:hypothetical protein
MLILKGPAMKSHVVEAIARNTVCAVITLDYPLHIPSIYDAAFLQNTGGLTGKELIDVVKAIPDNYSTLVIYTNYLHKQMEELLPTLQKIEDFRTFSLFVVTCKED